MTDASAAPPPAAPSIMDCAEIYYAPTDVFARRREGKFGMPLLVFVIVTAVIFLATRNLIQPMLELDFNRSMAHQMAANPQFTQEMADKAHATMLKIAPIGAVISAAIIPLLVGLVIWIVAKVAGAGLDFAQGMTVGVFTMYPGIAEQVGNAVQMALNGGDIQSKYDVSVGPARFMGGSSELARTIVGHLDLWTVWMAFIVYVGVRTMGRTSRQTAMLVAIIAWVLGALPAVIGALRAG